MRTLALAVVSGHMEGGQERWAFKRNTIAIWLVVLTILKNISQWEGLSILWNIKHVWNHQPAIGFNGQLGHIMGMELG